MTSLFISLLTLVLILISAFVVLLVLMQRTSQSGGMGAALGGGATESAFGSDTNNVLTKATIYSTIAFFVISLGLFLFYQSKATERTETLNPEELIRSPQPEPSEAVSIEDVSTALEDAANSVAETSEKVLTEADSNVKITPETEPVKSDTSAVDAEAPVETEVPVSN